MYRRKAIELELLPDFFQGRIVAMLQLKGLDEIEDLFFLFGNRRHKNTVTE